MRFKKGSPEAAAYMASIRTKGPRGPRAPRAPREGVIARADGDDGFSATEVRDVSGNVAGAVSVSNDYLAGLTARIEAAEERRRIREERDRDKTFHRGLIVAGAATLVWLMFIKAPAKA